MTIKDIARIANVSKSAVSLALNGHPGVSDETRQLIVKIANENGYSLKKTVTGKNKLHKQTIRFLICINNHLTLQDVYNSSFFTNLISGIENRSKQLNYSLAFASCEKSTLENAFYDDNSSGTILLATYCQDDDLQFLTKFSDKVVLLDNYTDILPINCVNMNSFQGAYVATEHLINLGHKHIGIVKSKINVRNFSQRSAGFFKCLRHNNITCNPEDVFTTSIEINEARDDFLSIISQRGSNMPTALFCECDFIAIGVMKALQLKDYSVPNDISIMGFDDVLQASIVVPELTTVKVEKFYMGALSVNRLHKMLTAKDNMSIKSLIDTKLQLRGSCKKL